MGVRSPKMPLSSFAIWLVANNMSTEEEKKVIKSLEEDDDEFEDFPSDTKWGNADTEVVNSLWEEDWEDDDNADDFSEQLRGELAKTK